MLRLKRPKRVSRAAADRAVLFEQLESIIDKHSLLTTIEILSEVCYEKEQHVRSNWLDDQLSGAWELAGSRLETVHHRLANEVDI